MDIEYIEKNIRERKEYLLINEVFFIYLTRVKRERK